MPDKPNLHQRRSNRLAGYDYSRAGAYYVTLVADQRAERFGVLDGGRVCLSQAGVVAEGEWLRLEMRFPGVTLDVFVIMPDHLHGILILPEWEGEDWGRRRENLADRGRARLPDNLPDQYGARLQKNLQNGDSDSASPLRAAPAILRGPGAGELGTIVGAYKSTTARLINGICHTPGARLWQRNYYEHIIRNEEDLERIRAYIRDNPRRPDDPD